MRSLILLPLLLAAGCAATPGGRDQAAAVQPSEAERLQQRLAGLTPGKPLSCLPSLPTTGSTAIGSTIIYRVTGSRLYVNHTSGGCEGMEHGDTLVTVAHGSQLCRGDIARTVDLVGRFPTGSCALGDFIPYTKGRS